MRTEKEEKKNSYLAGKRARLGHFFLKLGLHAMEEGTASHQDDVLVQLSPGVHLAPEDRVLHHARQALVVRSSGQSWVEQRLRDGEPGQSGFRRRLIRICSFRVKSSKYETSSSLCYIRI